MNKEAKKKPDFRQQLKPVVHTVVRYRKFLYGMMVLLLVTFIAFRINQLATLEPSQSAIDEKLQSVTRPRVDQDVLDQIQQLQDRNVEVQSLFDQARKNPFSE